MSKKSFFLLIPLLFLTAFLSHAQEMKTGLYPLTQYSVGGTSSSTMQLRTTSLPQNDTLKIPYIEDFSGPGVPIDKITIVPLSADTVYQIRHLKMHGLKSGDSLRVFNASKGTINPPDINGLRYAKVIDKYAFQLFDDHSLAIPSKVDTAILMNYCNWLRVGAEGYSTTPDTLGFLNNNGGVFINNDMALNPISIGVATFDGVDYRGIPYSTSTTPNYGDNLTSLPFNLSMYQPKDSVYMSFYWQSKSLGDAPLASEFLSLEFRDTTSATENWIQVWKMNGNSQTQDTFNIAVVAIRDSAYLHKGFQYRFRSYGVLNGRFNVWNLDYIYINAKRNPIHPYLGDVSIVSTSRNALKNYTSVPYKHMASLTNSAIINETAQAFMRIRDIFNIYNNPDLFPVPIERKHYVRDNLHVYPEDTVKFELPADLLENQSELFTQTYDGKIIGSRMTKPYVLKEEFYYQNLDTTGIIDLSFNNFAAIETYFYDYYSYDDNTPEAAFLSINAGGTKVANAYTILQTDSLTHIDYCFIRNNGPDMTNTTIFLNVWKKADKITTENTITTQAISIEYSPNINGFVRYKLKKPIKLTGGETYYFGYTQNAYNALFLGYDKNNDNLDKIFFCNNGVDWQPFKDNNSITGSLMIRPVFYSIEDSVITSTKDNLLQQNQFTFYPNPAKAELHFTGQPEYISVYDLSGLLILQKKLEDSDILSVETLSNGLYLLILSKGDYQEVKRLIIQK